MFANAAPVFAALLLTACVSNQPKSDDTVAISSAPSACQHQAQSGAETGVYSALAQGSSRQDAITLALADIANQRQLAITTTAISQANKQAGVVEQSFSRRVETNSDFVFTDYEVVCQDYVRSEALVHFDDRALTARIVSKLNRQHGSNGWQMLGDEQLLNSPALHTVRNRQGLAAAALAVRVSRNSQGWVLVIGPHRFQLRDEEWRLLYRLPHSNNQRLSVSIENEFGQALSHSLFHEQEFRFAITGELEANYFFSLYYIDHQGKVVEIRSNEPHTSQKKLLSPSSGIYTAELLAEYDVAIDDYIVMISDKALARPNTPWLYQGWVSFFHAHQALGLRLTVR